MVDTSVVDTRLATKPDRFYGDFDKWADWNWGMLAYLGAVRSSYPRVLEAYAKDDEPLDWELMDADDQAHAQTLYFILANLVKSKAQKLVRRIKDQNGLMLYRTLYRRYEPKMERRHLGMLTTVLKTENYFTSNTLEGFEEELEEWEEALEKYEGSAEEEIPDSVKRAVLTEAAPKIVQDHLSLNAGDIGNYYEMKTIVLDYLASKRTFPEAKENLNKNSKKTKADDMDVDAIWGKGKKAKEKGKGERRWQARRRKQQLVPGRCQEYGVL